MLAQIAAMPDGQYFGESVIEDDGYGSGDEHIGCRIVVAGNHMAIRMESPPQSANYRNSYWGNTLGAIYLGVLTALDPGLPINEGLYRPLDIDLGPSDTAERRASRRVRRQHLESLGERVRGGLRRAQQDRAPSCQRRVGPCRMNSVSGIDPRDGAPYGGLMHITFTGGSGAVYGHDGGGLWGSIVTAGAAMVGDVEMLEFRLPVFISRHELTRDSAMPGRWRGAPAQCSSWKSLGTERR